MLVLTKFVKYIGYKYYILHFSFPVKSAQSNNYTYFFSYCPSDILSWILAIKYALWLLFKQAIFKMVNFTLQMSAQIVTITFYILQYLHVERNILQYLFSTKNLMVHILQSLFTTEHGMIFLSIEIRSSLIQSNFA